MSTTCVNGYERDGYRLMIGLFQTSSIDGEDNYSFWTNDADTAGMPLVSLYSDSLGNIVDAEYLAPNSVSETWNCTGNAC